MKQIVNSVMASELTTSPDWQKHDYTVRWYDANAARLAPTYEAVESERLHGWCLDLLPPPGARVLDIGAGTGRDAAWLAGRGYSVVAVEPSEGMREHAIMRHANLAIEWITDSLPDLECVPGTAAGSHDQKSNHQGFGLILLSAVWQHVAPAHRARAFERVRGLLSPGGLTIITLRFGHSADSRLMYQVSEEEVLELSAAHGGWVTRRERLPDRQGRPDVTWTQLALRF